MGIEIRLARDVTQAIAERARAAWPQEGCGLLLGASENGAVRVSAILPAANVAPDPSRHFEVDPAVLIGVHRAARSGGLAVVGCYHSHPSGVAVPSATDAAMAGGQGRVWAIAAPVAVPVPGGGAASLWRIGWWWAGDDGFETLSTRVDDG
ncbi:MAG TPA: M67 family metallopeptidase [Novosphingobium sp.]|nr:M67 family metallopeptidase [Novosphingobium sp.]